jgi:hypothetical protein
MIVLYGYSVALLLALTLGNRLTAFPCRLKALPQRLAPLHNGLPPIPERL